MRRWITGALPWILVVPGAIWAVARLGGWDRWSPATQLMAFTPYVAAATVLPLVIVVSMRRWTAATLALATTLTLTACVVPRGFADPDALAGAAGPTLRVMTANVQVGRASAEALVELVRAQRVDVLVVQELTPALLRKLDRTGLADLLPHRVIYAAAGTVGSGIFSRLPMRDDGVRLLPRGFVQAKAEIVESGLLIESVHPAPPAGRTIIPAWREGLANQPPATVDGPLRVLAGDFNATLDHSLLRALIFTGYRDAADVVGEGLTGTWGPYTGDLIPPVTLDRVLADRRIGVASVEVFDLPGSDHRPVLATLVLPARAG